MKTRFLILAMALLVLLAVPALAENHVELDYPVNPYYEAANHPPTFNLANQFRMYLASDLRIDSVTESGDSDYFSENGHTWTVNASGGDGNYTYEFYLIERNSPFGSSSVHGYQAVSTSNTFNYRFMVSDDYRLWVYLRDGSNNRVNRYYDFALSDPDHPPVTQVAANLVAQCRAAGCTSDFDTALWLHDWLTMNARYDYSYTYYSADGVLLRGTGVCDSYSKAYVYLLEAANIPVDRVSSSAMGHAWNIAQLDGQWYQIDATWDDPNNSSGPVSGYENHFYFALPDAIMSGDHTYSCPTPCTAYADNYFIHTGLVSTLWSNNFTNGVQSGLEASQLKYQLTASSSYRIEKQGYYSSGKDQIPYGLAAYDLSQRTWILPDGDMHVDVGYIKADRVLPVSVRMDGSALSLPDDLLDIEAGSFENDSGFMEVILPDGAQSVGANAFAGCARLWKIVIPDSVQDIDASAFTGCPHLNIVCHSGSAAQQFALGNNINCVLE